MVRLCLGLKYDISELTKDISGMLGQDGK